MTGRRPAWRRPPCPQTGRVPSALPDGEPVPADGALPAAGADRARRRARSALYLHVPFCASRCGYCDFNTYVGSELGGGALQASYADTAAAELRAGPRGARRRGAAGRHRLRRRRHADAAAGRGPRAAARRGRATSSGLAPGAEVTTEANPDSVDERYLADLREGGFTRVSFGMQSAVAVACCACSTARTRPGRPQQAAKEAFAAGFEQVSLDLIYGTPGETDDDWRASLDAALGAGPDARVGVRPHRRGRHPARPRRSRAGCCRRPTTTCSPTATCSPSRRCGGARAGTR